MWRWSVFLGLVLASLAAKAADTPPADIPAALTSEGSGSSGGGDKFTEDFGNGLRLALRMIERVDTAKFPNEIAEDRDVIDFFTKRRSDLAKDLAASPMYWRFVHDGYAFCGKTERSEKATIYLYKHNCRGYTLQQIARLFINEAVHHLNKDDAYATLVSVTVVNAYPKGIGVKASPEANAKLLEEASRGNLPEVEDALTPPLSANPNFKDYSGNTALILAARGPCPDRVISLLLFNSAYVDTRNDAGYTALDYLLSEKVNECRYQSWENSVLALVGASQLGSQTVDQAVVFGVKERKTSLLDKLIDHAPSTEGMARLIQYAIERHESALLNKALGVLPDGAALDYRLDGYTALGIAMDLVRAEKSVSFNHWGENNTSYDARYSVNYTPRATAEVVGALLDHGANAKVISGPQNVTPLIQLLSWTANPQPELVTKMLKHGADVRALDARGYNAWDWFATIYYRYQTTCAGEPVCQPKLDRIVNQLREAAPVPSVKTVEDTELRRVIPFYYDRSGVELMPGIYAGDPPARQGPFYSYDLSYWCEVAKTICAE